MSQDTLDVEKWLYSLLSSDEMLQPLVGGRVYSYLAPEGAAYPLILFGLQAGSDLNTLGEVRGMSRPLYQIKVVGQGGDFGSLKPIADRMDALLQGGHQKTTEIVCTCQREQALQYPETSNGIRYNHLGGLWRIFVQGTLS